MTSPQNLGIFMRYSFGINLIKGKNLESGHDTQYSNVEKKNFHRHFQQKNPPEIENQIFVQKFLKNISFFKFEI